MATELGIFYLALTLWILLVLAHGIWCARRDERPTCHITTAYGHRIIPGDVVRISHFGGGDRVVLVKKVTATTVRV